MWQDIYIALFKFAQKEKDGRRGRHNPPFYFKDQVFLLDYPGAPVEELAAVFHTLPEVPSASFQ